MPTDPTTIPGYKWAPGMLAVTPDGIRIRLNAEREHVRCVEGSAVYRRGQMVRGPLPAGSQPDPSDPATAGCLLALLGPMAQSRQVGPAGSAAWAPRDLDADEPRYVGAGGEHLGAACIAVAEALGRWPGGATWPPASKSS